MNSKLRRMGRLAHELDMIIDNEDLKPEAVDELISCTGQLDGAITSLVKALAIQSNALDD